MAARLQQQGHTVAYLGLLDGFPSATEPGNTIINFDDRGDQLREQIHTLGLQKIGIGSDRQLDAVIDITVNNTRLMYEYSPAVVQGNVSFFEATEQKQDGPRQCPELWAPYVCGDIRNCQVTATHGELLDEPHAALIGRVITKAITDLWNNEVDAVS